MKERCHTRQINQNPVFTQWNCLHIRNNNVCIHTFTHSHMSFIATENVCKQEKEYMINHSPDT